MHPFITSIMTSSKQPTTHSSKIKARRKSNKKRQLEITLTFYTILLCLLSVYFERNQYFIATKNETIQRTRRDFQKDIVDQLGPKMFRRSYRMPIDTFNKLHHILQPQLHNYFFPKNGGSRNPVENSYLIDTKIRLSIAIRYFAGASAYDLMLTHGVCYRSIFYSIWGVVDCVNNCKELEFHFPTLEEQADIASGFQKDSGAKFDHVVGAIDGILIWILKPSKHESELIKIADGLFKCYRKDKFGMNMQAICDHKLRIRWIDIRFPGNASDYMSWATSSLCKRLDADENGDVILKGKCILGDNAYVKTHYMTTPYKYNVTPEKDSYNFYQSQLRIKIECTFGVLVHRWAVLRSPLQFPLCKVTPIMSCLCRLHNFCIDEKEKKKCSIIESSVDSDLIHLQAVVNNYNKKTNVGFHTVLWH